MLGLGSSLATSGVSSEFSLDNISGLVMWLKNGTGVAVSQWDDSSGQDNHVTQGTASLQPALDQGGLDFASDRMNFTDNLVGSVFTYFFAVELDINNQSQCVFGSTVTDNDFIRLNQSADNEFDIKRNNGGLRQLHSHSTDFTTSAHVFMVRSKADKTDFGVDDDIDEVSNAAEKVLSINLLGVQKNNNGNPLNGTVLEVAMYNVALSDEDVVLVREDIAERLGL